LQHRVFLRLPAHDQGSAQQRHQPLSSESCAPRRT
jgi:hypothetical protein